MFRAAGYEHKIIFRSIERPLPSISCAILLRFMTDEVDDERIFHSEHSIAADVRIAGHKQLADYFFESGRLEDYVDMRSSHIMSLAGIEDDPGRSIFWNRIRNRFNRPKAITAVLCSSQTATESGYDQWSIGERTISLIG
jgi:hypothetical protein